MPQKVRKAVIPCAGYGTRFLPMTKASPKEMLPVVDKPVIQYIVEEAVASGIEEIILITGSNKRAIEDHFDYNFELEETLKRGNKMEQYNEIRAISDMAKFIFVRQKEQLGNGHAVLQAKEVVGDEPFVVLWGDDICAGKIPRTKQMIDAYEKYNASVINVITTTDAQAPFRYAIITGEKVSDTDTKIDKITEKPGESATSPYHASVGGYVFTPSMFSILETLPAGKNGEIWLPDAIKVLLERESVYAHEFQGGKYYDCGNKLEYLKANIDLALEREDIGKGLRDYLAERLKG